ncbi:MAG: phage major tail protein, TP901-1 family [Sphingobacteriia bacterium]|nr:phage major tail protein, TP901-1 family [Sphingobacteriia bacterium]
MNAYAGALMLLKIKDNSNKFITIGGMRTTRMVLNNQIIDSTHKLSGNWRELLSGGIKSISISGSGIFTNSESEEIIRKISFNSENAIFQLCFGNGDILSGSFIITSYERSGNYQDEESYNLTIESSGKIDWQKFK